MASKPASISVPCPSCTVRVDCPVITETPQYDHGQLVMVIRVLRDPLDVHYRGAHDG